MEPWYAVAFKTSAPVGTLDIKILLDLLSATEACLLEHAIQEGQLGQLWGLK